MLGWYVAGNRDGRLESKLFPSGDLDFHRLHFIGYKSLKGKLNMERLAIANDLQSLLKVPTLEFCSYMKIPISEKSHDIK